LQVGLSSLSTKKFKAPAPRLKTYFAGSVSAPVEFRIKLHNNLPPLVRPFLPQDVLPKRNAEGRTLFFADKSRRAHIAKFR
jgi:hypothetical protein